VTTPLVSVCIVTFNHEHYIHDCVMSVVDQARDVALEIIIGDDVSEDSTQEIVEELATRYPTLIQYHRNRTRLGPAGNYLSLIERSRGRFVAHLDGDDLWLPGKLEAQVSYLQQHSDCSVVYSNALTIREDGTDLGFFNNRQKEKFDLEYLLMRGNFLCLSSMLYRAEFKADVLALPVPFIDYRVHLLLARKGDLGYINRHLLKYRVNSGSSILVNTNDVVRELYWDAISSVPRQSVSTGALNGCVAEFGRSVFFAALRRRNWRLFRTWLPVMMSFSPAGRVKMSLLVLAAIMRAGLFAAAQELRQITSRESIRILYRR